MSIASPVQRPREVHVAFALVIASLLLTVAVTATRLRLFGGPGGVATWPWIVPGWLYAPFFVPLLAGRNGARIALAVIGAVQVLMGVVSLFTATGFSVLAATLYYVSLAFTVAAIVFMILPASNAFFSRR